MTTAPQCIPIADHPIYSYAPPRGRLRIQLEGKVVEEQTPKVVLKDITLEYKTNRSPLLALDRINLQVKTASSSALSGLRAAASPLI